MQTLLFGKNTKNCVTISKNWQKNFELLKKNPYHPSLHLKKVGRYWSVRVGKNIELVE